MTALSPAPGTSAIERSPAHGEHPLRILLIQRPTSDSEALEGLLNRDGHSVRRASSDPAALGLLNSWQPALILLDLSNSDGLGLETCRMIHSRTDTPIVLLVSPGGEAHVLVGLELGAVDYLTRPLDPEELRLRIAVATRSGLPVRDEIIEVGPVAVHMARREVFVRGNRVHVPRLEYELLCALILRPGRIRTREELLQEVWSDSPPETKTLEVHIRRLRQKVEENFHEPRHVITVRGVGYYFDPSDSISS